MDDLNTPGRESESEQSPTTPTTWRNYHPWADKHEAKTRALLEEAAALRNQLLYEYWVKEYGSWQEFLSAHQIRPKDTTNNTDRHDQ